MERAAFIEGLYMTIYFELPKTMNKNDLLDTLALDLLHGYHFEAFMLK